MPSLENPPVSRRWGALRWSLYIFIGLITLIALLWLEENLRGKHAWLKYKAALEARGEKLDFNDFVPPQVPDDQNFAMTPLLAPLFNFASESERIAGHPSMFRDTNAQNRALLVPQNKYPEVGTRLWTKSEPLDLNQWVAALTNPTNVPAMSQADAATEILRQFQALQPQMDELIAAGHRPYSRFGVHYDPKNPPGTLLPHLAVLKRLGMLFSARASAELKLGQTDAAVTDIKMVMYLADAESNEPFMISHLVRVAIGQIALEPLWIGLAEHKWTDAQLAEFQQRLAQTDFLAGCAHSMRGELAMDIATIESMRNGTLRASDMLDQGNDSLVFDLMPSGMYYQNAVNVARLFADYALPPLDPAGHRILMDKAALFGQADRELTKGFRPYRIFAMLLFPSMSGFTMKSAAAQVRIDEAIIACGLERYRIKNGQYPDSFEALKPQFINKLPNDVITGKPLIYRRNPDGRFILYSIGWNNKDDGGIIGVKGKEERQKLEEGDWVWPEYPAK